MSRDEFSGRLNNSAGLLRETRRLSPVRNGMPASVKLLAAMLTLLSVAALLAVILWRMWR